MGDIAIDRACSHTLSLPSFNRFIEKLKDRQQAGMTSMTAGAMLQNAHVIRFADASAPPHLQPPVVFPVGETALKYLEHRVGTVSTSKS